MQSPLWSAVQDELNDLASNNTWSLVPLPGGRIPIGCKWLFKMKRNSDWSIARYKARLIAKGFSQKPGFDFEDMFSHVLKARTVRIILTLALSYKWHLRYVDVNNAIPHGDLAEDVFMVNPPGFEKCDACGKVLVCKILKALYGLKQAPGAWFERLNYFSLILYVFCLST